MTIKPPPSERIQDQNGIMSSRWVLWFQSIFQQSKEGASGTFTTTDAKTVTVVKGIITDIA